MAALATLDSAGSDALRLHGRVISLGGEPDGRKGEDERRGADAEEAERLGAALAERLLGEGAAGILAEVRARRACPVVSEP